MNSIIKFVKNITLIVFMAIKRINFKKWKQDNNKYLFPF